MSTLKGRSQGGTVSTLHERLLTRVQHIDRLHGLNRHVAVDAVRAVVELHRQALDVPLCLACWNGADDYQAWPCDTIRAIADALGVETGETPK